MKKRPILNEDISLEDFKDFYWLKSELLAFCRSKQINASGGKKELEDRIILFLTTGERVQIKNQKKSTKTTDWRYGELSVSTIIDDHYKNNYNVRDFMRKIIGSRFHYNVDYLEWIKNNKGKTLADAAKAWLHIESLKKSGAHTRPIAPQFEYNTYIRDFLTANPKKTKAEAIRFWNIKKTQRGSKKYHANDLNFEI